MTTPVLSIWNSAGLWIAHAPLKRMVTSVAACDSDIESPLLNSDVFFVNSVDGSFLLLNARNDVLGVLKPGEIVRAGCYSFLLGTSTNELPNPAMPGNGSEGLLANLMSWIARPMQGELSLRQELERFLKAVISEANALNGILVLADVRGYAMAASSGISEAEAQEIWNKMPASLAEDIMRSAARVVLPEGLREKVAGKSTLFVRDIRSVVGFPICAEGAVLGILYLNFRNVLLDLSLELQSSLAVACDLLGMVIQRALLREEVSVAKVSLSKLEQSTGKPARLLVGASKAIETAYVAIAKLAAFDVPVLVTGETGTGKDLVAQEIHRWSSRAQKPFVAINAAAVPESLFESELFGHKKGAFTGAIADREGLVEKANGGTLFIDELGEMPLAMQAKLLRVLQDKKVVRVGESNARSVDFRLVGATNRNLLELAKQGKFREDLYYRVAGATIALPPLRERGGDVVLLAKFFKERFCEKHHLPQKEFSVSALDALQNYAWPGNVRELENLVSRAAVMAESLVIRAHDLGLGSESEETARNDEESFEAARDAWTRTYLVNALARHNNNRVNTAKALGIGERTLFRYLEQLGIRGQQQ